MSERSVRLLVALVVPIAALAAGHWFDQSVLRDALDRGTAFTYEYGGYAGLLSVTHVVGAIGTGAVVLAAFRARSMVVGLGYAVVGGGIVLVPAVWAAIVFNVNGSPTGAAPEPVARFLNDQMLRGVAAGPTGIELTIGGGMLVAGLAMIALQLCSGLAAFGRSAPASSSRTP